MVGNMKFISRVEQDILLICSLLHPLLTPDILVHIQNKFHISIHSSIIHYIFTKIIQQH